MSKIRNTTMTFISKVKKRKVPNNIFKAIIKYSFKENEREYILKKLDAKYWDLAYGNPLPKSEEDIAKDDTAFDIELGIISEIKWYFEVFKLCEAKLDLFSEITNEIERNILLNKTHKVDELLERIGEEICSSLYLLILEMYLNEKEDKSYENEQLIESLSVNGKSSRLPLIAVFARMRMEKDLNRWQYDSHIEHHMSLYSNENKQLIDYVILKFDPFNFEHDFFHKEYLLNLESDFSIVDRNISIQTIIPLILHKLAASEKEQLAVEIKKYFNYGQKIFWSRLLFVLENSNTKNLVSQKEQEIYDSVADLYFSAKYKKVAEVSSNILKMYPDIQELHSLFVKSVIFISKKVSDYFSEENVLTKILTLMKTMYKKDSTYTNTRERLVEEFYKHSFFNFSNCLLQDLYSEFHFEVPKSIILKVFLQGNVISNRSISIIQNAKPLDNPALKTTKWYNFVKEALSDIRIELNFNNFHQIELYVTSKIYIENYSVALDCLNEYANHNCFEELPEFVNEWYNRMKIKCLFKLNQVAKATNLIVQEYFRLNKFYDFFYYKDIITELIENDESLAYRDISVPIFFQITKQTQGHCYDSIANFLIHHNLHKPTELVAQVSKFDKNSIIFFFEKCCVKRNLEDSPFINSIDALSNERISLLNCLKEINPEKQNKYNEEILNITKEDTIRKAVKHIHESRIFIDTDNIFKILNAEISEIFDRYRSLDSQKYSALSAMTFDELFDPNRVDFRFYCKEKISPALLKLYILGEPLNDTNIVRVPLIRYTNFILLFEDVRDEFIFNEDFGFKSFLSMRIRHGTFSNVLRSVFDKYNLIGSKESSIDEYKEISYWNKENKIQKKFLHGIQEIFKIASRSIDEQIDLALSWIKVKEDEEDVFSMFNFNYTEEELKAIFINRVGRIDNSGDFITEVFTILYERLELQLNSIQERIGTELASNFIAILDQMETEVLSIYGNNKRSSIIEEQIIACKTEIQLVTNQVQKWFKVSQSHYVEEFPIDMILEASIDYINSINGNILSIATVERDIKCTCKYKGKYFEGFGDMFINIFDNIIKNNKDLIEELKINVMISSKNGQTRIKVSNNLSPKINVKDLKRKIEEIKRNVNNYKDGNMINSFEDGSGYLKICRCISADLEQTIYDVNVEHTHDKYEVQITIQNKNLII